MTAKLSPVLRLLPASNEEVMGNYEARATCATFASSPMRLTLASVGKGPKDGASVLIHCLTQVHGDGEEEDQEE